MEQGEEQLEGCFITSGPKPGIPPQMKMFFAGTLFRKVSWESKRKLKSMLGEDVKQFEWGVGVSVSHQAWAQGQNQEPPWVGGLKFKGKPKGPSLELCPLLACCQQETMTPISPIAYGFLPLPVHSQHPARLTPGRRPVNAPVGRQWSARRKMDPAPARSTMSMWQSRNFAFPTMDLGGLFSGSQAEQGAFKRHTHRMLPATRFRLNGVEVKNSWLGIQTSFCSRKEANQRASSCRPFE